MEPKTTDKRIVSKGEYVTNIGKKAIVSSISMAFLMIGLVGFALALVFLLIILGSQTQNEAALEAALIKAILCLCAAATVAAVGGYKSVKRAAKIKPGIPLTRANTADLPAPESLVRASEEPMQVQEAVLLRAAMEGQETPPEQLVRAVTGQE